jgi:hypothetical protein
MLVVATGRGRVEGLEDMVEDKDHPLIWRLLDPPTSPMW